jgi:hypothetical protein
MDSGTTYDVRVYRTEVYKGSRVTTYKVRWKVSGRLWKEGFRTAAQADSFRSSLLIATRKGEAFSLETGKPTAWERSKAEVRWYEFACRNVDMKWKLASAKYRKTSPVHSPLAPLRCCLWHAGAQTTLTSGALYFATGSTPSNGPIRLRTSRTSSPG